jgi:hypothetical protein
MYYKVQCTDVRMYISDLKKKLSKMFQIYSKLCLPGQYGKLRRAGQYMSKDAKHKPVCTPPNCRLLQKRFIYRLLTRHGCLPVWLAADK